eukprot:jgi/Mesvir1/11240/Mv22603-RA.1
MRGPMMGMGMDMGGMMDGARARASAPSLTPLDHIVQDTLSSTGPSNAVIVETLDGKMDDESVTGSTMGDQDVRTVQVGDAPKKKTRGRKKKTDESDVQKVVMDL